MVPQVTAPAEQAAGSAFNAGELIIGHVSNTPLDHAIIHLPTIFGINLSVTKHVFMLWFVAAGLFLVVTTVVRSYLKQPRLVPTGLMNALEAVVEFIRDTVVEPNIGAKRVNTWTPLLLTFFLFILCANAIGLVPIFDVLGLLNHYVVHGGENSFLTHLVHGGPTATSNYNVTAGLAVVTFFATIVAGTSTYGFVKHWTNIVPHGLPKPLYVLLIPMETLAQVVRPFALTMRLAANMTGGHIAILAILSFVFIFTHLFGTWVAGAGTRWIVWPGTWTISAGSSRT